MDGFDDMAAVLKGSSASGNYGHAGRPGQRGGSSRGEQFGMEADAKAIAAKLGVPEEVASYMLRAGLVGVHLPSIYPTRSAQATMARRWSTALCPTES